jgi:uncharacterized protein (TIGR03067 family)
MKPRLFPAAFFAMFAFVFPLAAHADDLQAMEGKWTIASAEAGGRNVDSEEMKALVVTIMGDHYELLTKEGPDGGSLKLDETQTPKTMDATKTEGLVVGKVIKAIYEISGDTMRVCYALDGSARPAEFATKEGSPWLLVTYQREK